MYNAKKGLFGKGMQPGAMMPAYSMPQSATMQDGASLGAPGEQPKQGMDWKGALLGALGGAADGAATFFGGQPLIAQNREFEQVRAMRQAEQERQRSMDLADYRTKLGIQQEFAGPPEAPAFIRNAEAFYNLSPEEQQRVAAVQDITSPIYRPGPDGQFYPIPRTVPQQGAGQPAPDTLPADFFKTGGGVSNGPGGFRR